MNIESVPRSRRARRRAAKYRLLGMIKKANGCNDCGYAEHASALQFDHIGNKKMNVSDMVRSDYGWDTILEEIRHCEIVCANCHAVRTAERKRLALAHMLQVVEVYSSDSLPDFLDLDSLQANVHSVSSSH